MSTEATVGIVLGILGFLGTIATIIYHAGRLSSKIDGYGKSFDAHVASDDRKFELLFRQDADQNQDVNDLRIHLGAERRKHSNPFGAHGAHGE